jgi:hypothetical protein
MYRLYLSLCLMLRLRRSLNFVAVTEDKYKAEATAEA